ncbi:hypothetical protein LINGRAHAP2_LOCUS28270 [Linum grandiflorum]
MNVPLPGMVYQTIHCDESFKADSHKAGYDIIISDTEGHIIDGKAGSFLCNSAIAAEAVAMLHSINYASSSDTTTIVKTDCQTLAKAIYTTKNTDGHGYAMRIWSEFQNP